MPRAIIEVCYVKLMCFRHYTYKTESDVQLDKSGIRTILLKFNVLKRKGNNCQAFMLSFRRKKNK